MNRILIWITAWTVALIAGLLGAHAADAPAIAFEECTLIGARGYGTVRAECGTLERPENPDNPAGATLELAVARIPALSPNPLPDAFTVINGGPGGSSIEMYADMAGAFQAIRRERDIVIVDQRGTGQSNPMACPEFDDPNAEYSEELVRSATQACLDSLPGDPRFYTTTIAVRDLDAVREALGYQQWNLYGVSYGTRVALHYLRRYPDAVRTTIIDGILPPGHPLGTRIALNGQNTLDHLFERCGHDTDCAAQFPDLPSRFAELSERLKRSSINLMVPDPITSEIEPFELRYVHMALALRLLNYAPETASLVPLLIMEAAERENYLPIASNAIRVLLRVTGAIDNGMHNAVVCTEDTPLYSEENLAWEAIRETFLGEDQLKSLITICGLWPSGIMDEDIHDDVTSVKPVLVLSGEHDPITPPEYGARVDATLVNSLHIVAPGQGHGVIARGCLPRLASEFVEQADWHALDSSCVQRLGPSPFFVNLMGPPP